MEELRQVNLFASCSESDMEDLLRYPHRSIKHKKGHIIVYQGDPCDSLIVLTKGEVETRMGSAEGREVVINHLDAPQVLAPTFLFASDNIFPVEVTALTECTVWHIDRDAFFHFMKQRDDVMREFLRLISDRGRFLSKKVQSFAVEGLRTRIVSYMKQHGSIGSVQACAASLGVARPSLSRLLSEMTDEGAVVRTSNGFELPK